MKPVLFVNFCQFPCFWIRICIPTTDRDPGNPKINADPDPLHCPKDECPLTNHNRAKEVGLIGLPEGGAGVEGAAVTRVEEQGAQQQLLGLLQ
jgi:hypothetical protein